MSTIEIKHRYQYGDHVYLKSESERRIYKVTAVFITAIKTSGGVRSSALYHLASTIHNSIKTVAEYEIGGRITDVPN